MLSLKFSRSDGEVLAADTQNDWPRGTAQCQLYAVSVLTQPADTRRTLPGRGRALGNGRVPGSGSGHGRMELGMEGWSHIPLASLVQTGRALSSSSESL